MQTSNYKLLDAAIFSSKTIETISEDSSIETMSEDGFSKMISDMYHHIYKTV